VPVTLAEFITTVPPDAVNVIDCVAGSFTSTSPKAMLVALTFRLILGLGGFCAGFSEMEKYTGEFQALADSVAVCAVETAATFAKNVPLDAPAGIDNVAGTVTFESLLPRVRLSVPPEAGYLSATLQESVPAPVIDPAEHEIAFTMPVLVLCPAALLVTTQSDMKAQANMSP
jgi:hypothetical protein